MAIFKLTNDQQLHFEQFNEQLEIIINVLSGFDNKQDISELTKLRENFNLKIKNFFDSDRCLNIGIVGQVKAGKSSFLNTLLFDGKSVLPKASTPKTATLTKIQYAEENAMEIEYYSEDDWEYIIENARSAEKGSEYESARELTKMANASNIDVQDLLKRERDRIVFTDYQELTERLNDYVGENGKYTALVKAVVLYANNPLFKELSIVDTPGLNDPVISRTTRTKEFIEICDVVYFLTPCSAFLDKSDWSLLSMQLPQKGVKRLILVGSKFDSSLRDVLRKSSDDDIFGIDPNTADNIPDAISLVRKKLTTRASQRIEEYTRQLRLRGASENLISVLDGCRKPVFISSIARNMSGRDESSLDSEERNIYNALSVFSQNIDDELEIVGGFAQVEAMQNEIVADKDKILMEKSSSFVPTAKSELLGLLDGFTDKANSRRETLSTRDRGELISMRNEVQGKIRSITGDISALMGTWQTNVETHRAKSVREMRSNSSRHQNLDEHKGTETKTESRRVSDSIWFLPWTWFSYHYESYHYDVSYSYLEASDAIDKIMRFTKDCENKTEMAFYEAVNHQKMKRELLDIVARNFDMGDEKYDASLFRRLVEDYVNKMTLPIIKVDSRRELDELTSKFSGEVRGSDKDKLKRALSDMIDSVYETLVVKFDEAARMYKSKLASAGDVLCEELLKNINSEFEEILKSLDEKEANISLLTEYMNQLARAREEIGL